MRSFAELSGFGVAPLVVPVVIAAGAAWSAWRGRRGGMAAATILMGIFILISGFSIGRAYIPALVLFVWGIVVFFG